MLCRVIHLGDLDPIMAGFVTLGFPNCRGAIDGSHIPIQAPEHLAAQYINCKGCFPMVLQAMVDHCGQFTDIFIGWSGRMHNARMFRNSSLYQKLETGTSFPQQKIMVGDMEMPLCIVGDVAYSLMLWLMKPYISHLDPSRDRFNV
uniref:DDE Tnp4 domain-containing protein n=1 Tax=Pelodiscus sinensis TaxID=13735 RepID=K7F1H8_PELSI